MRGGVRSLSLLCWIPSRSRRTRDGVEVGRLGRHPRHLPLQHLGDHGHGDGLPVASKSEQAFDWRKYHTCRGKGLSATRIMKYSPKVHGVPFFPGREVTLCTNSFDKLLAVRLEKLKVAGDFSNVECGTIELNSWQPSVRVRFAPPCIRRLQCVCLRLRVESLEWVVDVCVVTSDANASRRLLARSR